MAAASAFATRAAAPERRSGWGRLALGALLIGGGVAASAAVARRYSPSPDHPEIRAYFERLEKPPFQPPDWAFAVWGPLFVLLFLSGLRLWSAPPGPERTYALSYWAGVQVLNAVWMRLGFGDRLRGANLVEAAATLAVAVAYSNAARRVDRPAAALSAPYLAWIAFAALLTEELWRRNRGREV